MKVPVDHREHISELDRPALLTSFLHFYDKRTHVMRQLSNGKFSSVSEKELTMEEELGLT